MALLIRLASLNCARLSAETFADIRPLISIASFTACTCQPPRTFHYPRADTKCSTQYIHAARPINHAASAACGWTQVSRFETNAVAHHESGSPDTGHLWSFHRGTPESAAYHAAWLPTTGMQLAGTRAQTNSAERTAPQHVCLRGFAGDASASAAGQGGAVHHTRSDGSMPRDDPVGITGDADQKHVLYRGKVS